MLTGVQNIVYNVVEQLILNLLRKEVTGERLDAYNVKYFDMYAVAEGSLKTLLDSSSFMTAIATLVTRKEDTAMDTKKHSVAYALKSWWILTAVMQWDGIPAELFSTWEQNTSR